MSYKVKLWYACHPHRAHEESFLARQELVKRGQVVLCFSLEHSLDVIELPFSTNLLFVLLFCFGFPLRIFFFFFVLTFSCLNWASHDHHLTILLLFVTLPFVPCMIVLYRLSHSAFSERSSLLGSLCQGYKAVLFQSRAGFLAWILGSQAAEVHSKNTGLDAISCPSLWEP